MTEKDTAARDNLVAFLKSELAALAIQMEAIEACAAQLESVDAAASDADVKIMAIATGFYKGLGRTL